MSKPASYLTKEGQEIFKEIKKHVLDKGIFEEVDGYELSMLCNSIDIYARCAEHVKENDIYQESGTNGYKQVSPQYTAMNKEYALILKHSPKFGINPTDRQKLLSFSKSDESSPLDKF